MKKLYLVLTLLFFNLIVNATSITGNTEAICPNELSSYSLTDEADILSYSWSVQGGTLETPHDASYANIRWSDKNETHKVTVSLTYAANSISRSLTVKVLSLKDKLPEDFTSGDFSINPGDKTPVTYEIPIQYYPHSYNNIDKPINKYEWVIPSGWIYNGNVSDGTPILTNDISITVTPDDCTSDSIKVRCVSDCNGMLKSKYRSRPISRNDNDIKSSASSTVCGKPQEIILQIESISGASYQWTKPSSWTWTSSTNTNIVKVMPDGHSAGIITISLNGCLSTENYEISLKDWDTSEQPPSISGAEQICSSYKSVYLNQVYSNTTNITWTASPSSLFYTTSGTGATASLKAKSSSVRGRGTITFTLHNQCGGTYPKTYDVWVGSPNFTLIGDPNLLYPRQRSTVTVDYTEDGFFLQGVNNVNWTYSGSVASLSGNIFKADFVTATFGEYGAIYALATNECGSKENRYYFELVGGIDPHMEAKKNSLSATKLNFESTNVITSIAIYPNPVEDIVNIQIPENLITNNNYSIEIYNLTGKLLIKKKVENNTNSIDLSNSPSGTYIVKLITDQEIITKKIIKK
ncbi:MAG: T9SS type A sorting domain-containing protein [Marinifilaceae bacterium]|nr:T9SS type A sorting domain-containing protein [Marinifilaceae bacterium]